MKKSAVLAGAGALAVLTAVIGYQLGGSASPQAAVAPASTLMRSDDPAVARLGALHIAPQELKDVFAGLTPQEREQLKANRGALEGWLRARLAQKAVLEQADAQGWRQRPEVEQQMRAATEQIVLRDYLQSVSQVPATYPTDAELVQAYDEGKAQWVTPALYRISQIFLANEGSRNPEQLRVQALELSKRGQAGASEFAALASQYSQDRSTAQQGGDSGLQPLQQLLPEVRGVVARLKVGAVSEPVQTAAGFHVIRLGAMEPARTATLAEVRDQLRAALRAQRQEQIAKAYLEGMLSTATLSIDGALLNQVLEGK